MVNTLLQSYSLLVVEPNSIRLTSTYSDSAHLTTPHNPTPHNPFSGTPTLRTPTPTLHTSSHIIPLDTFNMYPNSTLFNLLHRTFTPIFSAFCTAPTLCSPKVCINA